MTSCAAPVGCTPSAKAYVSGASGLAKLPGLQVSACAVNAGRHAVPVTFENP